MENSENYWQKAAWKINIGVDFLSSLVQNKYKINNKRIVFKL